MLRLENVGIKRGRRFTTPFFNWLKQDGANSRF